MSIYPIILSQGEFINKEDLTYPFEERGLQFGDGVYEVIRIYQGNMYLQEEHIARLFRSLEAIRIQWDYNIDDIRNMLEQLIEKNNMTNDGHIYMQVSRGSAPRVHTFPENIVPNMYAYVIDQPRNTALYEDGVRSLTLPDERWDNCYIKSLNLLPNILVKQKALENGCYDGIMHIDGLVTECGSSNIYLVKDGKIYTHPTTKHILEGCVRMAVERFAKDLSIPFIEEAFSVNDIFEADEMFLTSSTSEVIPVVNIDQTDIADGKPGDTSKKLQAAYEKDANINA